MKRFLLMALPALLIAGCGDPDQSKTADNTNRGDSPPWQGTKNGFAVQGWNGGDKAAWESQMRARSQTQNEYAKVN